MNTKIKIIRRIHAHLRREHNKKAGERNVLAVGLGWAMRNGRPDLARGQALLYVVRRKMSRVPKRMQIPPIVWHTIPASRRRPKQIVEFRTDVIEVPEMRPTGVVSDSGTEHFTSGALIQWTDSGTQRWGLLSVGHGVNNTGTSTVTIEPPGGARITGQVIASTSETDTLDAALIGVDAGFAASLPAPAGGAPTCRSIDDLMSDGQTVHPSGFSLRSGGAAVFVVYGFLPAQDASAPLLSDAPNRRDLLLVQGRTDDFDPGTSGSVWIGSGPQSPVDAIQIGAFLPDYGRGMGQPMTSYLDWASAQVGTAATLARVF